MAEFVLEGRDAPEFGALDGFTRGYITCIFFTECETGMDRAEWESDRENLSALPDDVGFTDLAPEALARIVADCKFFQEEAETLLAWAYEDGLMRSAYTPEYAGHDFWLTRNRHGAGFWDRAFGGERGTLGQELTDLAHKRRELSVYLGDDGRVYLL